LTQEYFSTKIVVNTTGSRASSAHTAYLQAVQR